VNFTGQALGIDPDRFSVVSKKKKDIGATTLGILATSTEQGEILDVDTWVPEFNDVAGTNLSPNNVGVTVNPGSGTNATVSVTPTLTPSRSFGSSLSSSPSPTPSGGSRIFSFLFYWK